MNKIYNPPTEAEIKKQVRKLDLQWRDRIVLRDGRVYDVIEAFDTMVKVSGGPRQYVYRSEIQSHYPYAAD
jgi:hypothetical protein